MPSASSVSVPSSSSSSASPDMNSHHNPGSGAAALPQAAASSDPAALSVRDPSAPLSSSSALPISPALSSSSALPTSAAWLEHVELLARFWMHPDAFGDPPGLFPTWRRDDGTRIREDDPQEELPEAGRILWRKHYDGCDYTRMMSRQTFAYGALFNLTGRREFLDHHLEGVAFLREHARDPKGGFFTRFRQGQPVPEDPAARTSQDLAYALVGLAMNAYLTGDPATLEVIRETSDLLFQNYWIPGFGSCPGYDAFRDHGTAPEPSSPSPHPCPPHVPGDYPRGWLSWTAGDDPGSPRPRAELVSQLDQINAYMLLSWRLLPREHRQVWEQRLRSLLDAMLTLFYRPEGNTFRDCPQGRSERIGAGKDVLDHGHRVKSFWMILLAALGLAAPDLAAFARKGMAQTLSEALQPGGRKWFQSVLGGDADWWIYAELDQAALTLALEDGRPVPLTVRTLLEEHTDRRFGEWLLGTKTHFWRNGFHSTEHTLVGILISEALRCRDTQPGSPQPAAWKEVPWLARDREGRICPALYFAPVPGSRMNFTPYVFGGETDHTEKTSDPEILQAVFRKITLPGKAGGATE